MAARSKKNRRMPEVPVSSFSDIAFLLLIFFILVTTFNKTRGFVSELPSGQIAQQTQKGDTPTVEIEGRELRFNDNPVTLDELGKRLAELNLPEKPSEEQKLVIMEGSAGVDYQTYYGVMATITNAGGVIAIAKADESE
jgi:biopolymer transport protein ExbD